jgi:pantothenate synthetase
MTSSSYDAEAREELLSKVQGVRTKKKKWCAISSRLMNSKQLYIGTYDTKEKAVLARLTADPIWIRGINAGDNVEDLRKLAMSAANEAVKVASRQGKNAVFDAILQAMAQLEPKGDMKYIHQNEFGVYVSEN